MLLFLGSSRILMKGSTLARPQIHLDSWNSSFSEPTEWGKEVVIFFPSEHIITSMFLNTGPSHIPAQLPQSTTSPECKSQHLWVISVDHSARRGR